MNSVNCFMGFIMTQLGVCDTTTETVLFTETTARRVNFAHNRTHSSNTSSDDDAVEGCNRKVPETRLWMTLIFSVDDKMLKTFQG